MRVRIVKTTKHYNKGEVIEVSSMHGLDLIRSGLGVMTKDITEEEMEHIHG